MLLSEKLKELRLKADLPQRKVAAAIDVDTATYCKFEKGVLRISREQLIKYADFLKANSKDLLALWLADQMQKTVSEESKEVINEAIKIVSKSNNCAMKQDTIQELRTFDDQIFEAVQEFLNNKEAYSTDCVLAINAKTKNISIASPSDCAKCDQYALASLIRISEQGSPEPDCDATHDLAAQYYFVR